MKIINVVGARPNFMKIAPLVSEFEKFSEIDTILVHTGQHYDREMSELFFQQLGLPEPDINLGVGSASHAVQTAEIMKAFEPVVIEEKPDAVLVVGDVNSTIACGLVAVKLGVKLIHVEAGLRSFDRTMPEEINRVLTDSISDFLFCTERSGVENLLREGVSADKIFLVGNVMIDTLLRNLEKSKSSKILEELNLKPREYAVLTLHRPANVDSEEVLQSIFSALRTISEDYPIIFPVHPRTKKNMERMGLRELIGDGQIITIDPLGYLDFLKLMANSKFVLTDSGGIQEETTILEVPCLTLRDNTERPVTCQLGTNQLVGREPEKILEGYRKILDGHFENSKKPPLWDGKAAERIVRILREKLG